MLSDWTFDHIGMAVSDIETTAKMYVAVGYSQTEQVYDPIQNVYICFLHKAGMPTVELLMPHDNTSPVQRTLDERGGGTTPYHICYKVEDMEATVAALRSQRYVLVRKPEPAAAFDNRRVAFLYNKQVGLIEIVEK